MGTLYVTEYSSRPNHMGQESILPIPEEPAVRSQVVEIVEGEAKASEPFMAITRLVRLQADEICSVRFGPDAVADTTAMRLMADTTEFFGVTGGHRVSVILND